MRDVRYRVGGDNAVLRSVLYDAWGQKCYWCHRPKDFVDIQIDHIIPQTVSPARLELLTAELALGGDFEIHDPANLAPICTSCNGAAGKGSTDTTERPRTLTEIDKANRLRDEIVKRVKSFHQAGRVTSSLVLLGEADIDDESIRRAFERLGPALFRKAATFDFTTRTVISVNLDEYSERPIDVDVVLSTEGRRALVVLEDVCYGDLSDVIDEPIVDLRRQLLEKSHDELEAASNEEEPVHAGEPASVYLRVEVNSLELERTASALNFRFGGEFETELMASVVRICVWDEGLDEMQGESRMTGTFVFSVSCDTDRVARLDAASDVFIEIGSEEHWID